MLHGMVVLFFDKVQSQNGLLEWRSDAFGSKDWRKDGTFTPAISWLSPAGKLRRGATGW